ncbi:MAG TPA: alpha/beta fold hydrolase BchO [Vineibacter sp.]|nr:alpha/beta fold hydrolase BchO [Vineibacter sp.]
MSEGLSWERDGADWPHRQASRFVVASGMRWHVQQWGQGPTCLLLHGTGAATHTWRDVAPLLADRFNVVAPDLPGHGFSEALAAHRQSLTGMAAAISELLETLDARPTLAVGHSAGAALLARMALDGCIAPDTIVSLNGAFLPFRGVAGRFVGPLARLLAINPLVPRLFAWGAGGGATVERLIRSTGSSLDARGAELYGRLLRNPVHVAGALAMMANWDLESLKRQLPELKARLVLVACGDDGAIPPEDAFRVRDAVPGATVTYLRHLGHLAHEERPDLVVAAIVNAAH